MVYDEFCCYFFSTCQVDFQRDLVVHFTMFNLGCHDMSTRQVGIGSVFEKINVQNLSPKIGNRCIISLTT
jgi:hypothetical protein